MATDGHIGEKGLTKLSSSAKVLHFFQNCLVVFYMDSLTSVIVKMVDYKRKLA